MASKPEHEKLELQIVRRQQEVNLNDFENKITALKKAHDQLLKNKQGLDEFIENALSGKQKELDDLIEEYTVKIEERFSKLEKSFEERNKRRASVVKSEIAKKAALVLRNSEVLAINKAILERISGVKNNTDKVLHDIQRENVNLIKLQEDIAFRERAIEKTLEKIKSMEWSVASGEESIKKRMAEANALYKKWKNQQGGSQ